jgi:hypothetical protein
VLPGVELRHPCDSDKRASADKVLFFLEKLVRNREANGGRGLFLTKFSDGESGWRAFYYPSRKTYAFFLAPGPSKIATDRWPDVVDCTYIYLARREQLTRLGLPNTVHRLYYTPSVGLYLVRP